MHTADYVIDKKFKVSVLIPVYGLVEAIEKCLNSLLIQDYPDYEVVFVMDRCSAETLNKLEVFSEKFDKTQLIKSDLPGIAAALNTGLSRCRGEYIARMDADDEMLAGRLRAQAEYLDKHKPVGLVSGLVLFDSKDASEGYRYYCEEINKLRTHHEMFEYRFIESPVAHPSVMFRRSLIDTFGCYSEEAVPEDYELWLRWFSNGVRFGKLNKEVIVWRDSINRASRVLPQYNRQAFDQVRMLYLIKHLKSICTSNTHIVVAGAGKYARKKIQQLISNKLPVIGISDLTIRAIDQLKFIPFPELQPATGRIVISFVSNRGAWQEIKASLTSRGFQAGKDYFPCA